jgi:3-deoxy-D-manno-octulosonic-acid transferase
LYNLLVTLGQGILPIAALFSPKLKRFVKGRKEVFKTLSLELNPTKKTIWMHAASLGEYEQGVPVLEEIRQCYPEHQIVLSFFSPSGFEVKKKHSTSRQSRLLTCR